MRLHDTFTKHVGLLVALSFLASSFFAPHLTFAQTQDPNTSASSSASSSAKKVPATSLRVYTEEYPPYNFTKDGKIQGYSVDVVNEIMRRNSLNHKIEMMPWARAYDETLKLPNRILFSLIRTPERETSFKWVGPLAKFSWVFLARKDRGLTIANMDDAKKVGKIGVVKEDVQDQHLRKRGFTNLVQGPNGKINLKKLVNGMIDLWFTTPDVYPILARESKVDPKLIQEVFRTDGQHVYIGFSKDTDDHIIRKWQTALDQMASEGFLDQLRTKWPDTQRH